MVEIDEISKAFNSCLSCLNIHEIEHGADLTDKQLSLLSDRQATVMLLKGFIEERVTKEQLLNLVMSDLYPFDL